LPDMPIAGGGEIVLGFTSAANTLTDVAVRIVGKLFTT